MAPTKIACCNLFVDTFLSSASIHPPHCCRAVPVNRINDSHIIVYVQKIPSYTLVDYFATPFAQDTPWHNVR